MFGLFNRKTHVTEASSREIFDLVRAQNHKIELLVEELEKLKGAHLRLRGQFYAHFGKTPDPGAPSESPEAMSLSDPRLTKAQVRARLAGAGKLKSRVVLGGGPPFGGRWEVEPAPAPPPPPQHQREE
jgi:hypothetical protein